MRLVQILQQQLFLHLVQQMVLWNPTDNRLYWLYGEWLNARGEVASARVVLEELVDARRLRNFPDLVSHWQILRAAADAMQGAPKDQPAQSDATALSGAEAEKAPAGLELPNWRTLSVGLCLGVVVCLLAQMQWRSLNRRR